MFSRAADENSRASDIGILRSRDEQNKNRISGVSIRGDGIRGFFQMESPGNQRINWKHDNYLAFRFNGLGNGSYYLRSFSGFRLEFKQWLIKGTLQHHCIHHLNQYEPDAPGLGQASTWWNSFQIGIGTKGSYYLYLRNQFRNTRNSMLNTWDGQINVGAYIPAKNTLLTGQNHAYRYEIFSLIRYNIGAYHNWASFIALRQHNWINADQSIEHKISLTVNLFRKGLYHFAGLFYTYYLYDSFIHDKENHLGAVGVKIVF